MKPDYVISKRRTPGWYWGILLTTLAFATIAFISGYLLRMYQSDAGYATEQENSKLEQQLAKAGERIQHLQQTLNIEVATAAASRQEMVHLQKKMREIEKELVFYRSVLAPEQSVKGLQIGALKLTPTDVRHYQFSLLLYQARDQSRRVSGKVSLLLIGEENGETVQRDFANLGALSEKNAQFQFKYLEKIEGTLELPEGFRPTGVRVIAATKGRNAETISQDFPWPSEVENKDVGQKSKT